MVRKPDMVRWSGNCVRLERFVFQWFDLPLKKETRLSVNMPMWEITLLIMATFFLAVICQDQNKQYV